MGMQAVEVAIGLVLMWLLLALACTAIVEWINERLQLRSQALAAGLAHLWREVKQAQQSEVALKFEDLPPVKSCQPMIAFLLRRRSADPPATDFDSALTDPGWRARGLLPLFGVIRGRPSDSPSYVVTTQIAAGIIGQLVQGAANVQVAAARADAVIEALKDSPFKSLLRGYLATANGSLAVFEKKLAAWFDGTLERIGGEFKRIAQRWSFLIALAICGALNADSIAVAMRLWQNPVLREAIADRAAGMTQPIPAGRDAERCRVVLGVAPPSDATPDERLDCLSQTMAELPLGWGSGTMTLPGGRSPASTVDWLLLLATKLAGIGLSALAVGLGAPFWFQVLNTLNAIRASGRPPVAPKAADA